MSARDRYHGQCKAALIKDGWKITDDLLHLRYGGQSMFVDLGAEEIIAAEKAGRRVAIEIKMLSRTVRYQGFGNGPRPICSLSRHFCRRLAQIANCIWPSPKKRA
jgi:XisH protein